PLTLREVAQAVGLHESTVSRALAGKYVDTPHGLFSFSALFGPGLGTADGGAASPGRVKRLIGERIAHESAAAPLSDQELASALQKEGIAVSRRTVAKYREEMRIPASGKRRRY
ncbi:MAG: RNA polymerase sigma-54 factor, partial [Bacteroidota bacterium]